MTAIATSRIYVILLSIILISWGTISNFNNAYSVLSCNGKTVSEWEALGYTKFLGQGGDDDITGTSGNDVIITLIGNDVIDSKEGDDVICTGTGDDIIDSGTGNDYINAANGNNYIQAGDGNNFIVTGDDDDTIQSGSGNDTIDAGDGNNDVQAGDGYNNITTGNDDDSIQAGSGDDCIDSGSGTDSIDGGSGSNTIDAGTCVAPTAPVKPILECVEELRDGNYRAHFGYLNENSQKVIINIGSDNNFTPLPQDRGQPTTFEVGRTDYYPNAEFSIDFDGSNLVWTLKGPDGNTRTSTASSNPAQKCPDVKKDIVTDKDDDDEEERKKEEKRKQLDKNRKKNQLEKTKKNLKDEINKIKELQDTLSPDLVDLKELKKDIKEKQNEIKELIQELKENHDYDQELKKDIKEELKEIKQEERKNILPHEKYTKQKIESKIIKVSKSDEPEKVAKSLGIDFKEGKTKIALSVSELEPGVLNKIESYGTIDSKNGKHIQVTVDVNNISKLRMLNGVEKIRPTFSAIQYEQTVLSEGVYFLDADIVQYAGITGKEVKVAVLDIAFDPKNSKIADNVADVKSFRQGYQYPIAVEGSWHEHEHGTAVAEIITDVAPDVQLYLYTMQTDIEFADAIDEAISQNVDIIVMAAGWPHLPTDGTSHITKKVEEAISQGIAFVVPSGNFANKHWEGLYSDSNLNGWHEFSSTDEGLSINVTENRIQSQEPIVAYLMWNEGLGDVRDFQLVLVDPLGQIVDYSANDQKTKDDTPFEYIHHIPEIDGLYALGVVFAGETESPADIPEVTLELFTPTDGLEHPVAHSSVAVPSDADGAIVVGAVNHMDGTLEPFSSQGPTNDGKLAPHVVGPDGVTTMALDGNPFFGTSATAPYIAGLAALLHELDPNISTDQLITEIQQNTKSTLFSLENDYDNKVGYGYANAVFMLQEGN